MDRLLTRLQSDPDTALTLGLLLADLPLEDLPNPVGRLALKFEVGGNHRTLGDLLALAWDERDENQLEEWYWEYVFEDEDDDDDWWAEPELDEAWDSGPRPHVDESSHDELVPGMSRSALEQWAAQNHVEDVLSWPIATLIPGLYQHFAAHTVSATICGKTTESHWFRGDAYPRSVQHQAIRALVDIAARTARGLHDEAQAAAWRTRPPEHPVLREVHAKLLAAREGLRATTLPRHERRADLVGVQPDPPTLEYGRPPFQIVLDPIEIPPLPPDPRRALQVVDAFLDALTAPSSDTTPGSPGSSVRESLEAALAVPRWRRDIDALHQMLAVPPLDPADDKPLLGWRVTTTNGQLSIEPVRCRHKKRGSGLVTRNVPLRDVPRALLSDPIDAAVHELLAPWPSPPRPVTLQALELLVGHPRVLPPGRSGEPIPVRRSRFTLSVELADGQEAPVARCVARLAGRALSAAQLNDALRHQNAEGGRLVVMLDEGLHVARLARRGVELAAKWLQRGPTFPAEAHDALLDSVSDLAREVPVQVAPALRGRRVAGDPRPLLLLHWEADAGLVVDARVRPVPELLPEIPGAGSSELFVRRDGVRTCVERDLDAEPAAIAQALAPLRLPDRASQGRFSWRLQDLQEALGVVERIQEHLTAFQVEWRGDVPRVGARVAASDLRLTVGEGRDWFGLKGAARHPDGAVDVAALLRSIDAGHDFVQVAQGTWARIDRAMRDQLALLSDGEGGAELSLLQAPVVAALAEGGAEIDLPVRWTEVLERLEAAPCVAPVAPVQLQATLRDYQLTGFRWLAALAHWAPGACLADDMGLGKTVQTIALLVHRAADGPALVVAPTSVVFNWQRELARFAPSLTVHVHHGAQRERAGSLGPHDVLLTTYGVLTRDAEALQGLHFRTAVLDEAQAIKNPSTRRSEAAFGLQADFRVALSGTPVENRVSELWSLFRFVAPGLLGSWSRFRDRFAVPIEVRGDQQRREVLARLVRPFVLRRTKEQVEKQLPSLTEAVIEVDLSEAERALYATARVRAVERLSRREGGHLQVFRELSTLRQLACHPRLVDAGSTVPSSKLRQLRRLVADLRANGHRALVFSQFVRHLALVREALEEDGVRLRYLDGSTPLSERRREVDAFQSGDGDVFLISLGAGGVGLNLTAANYVIHLDPWWNPAVEDQATDRSHRIGQTRPVTVYRLVSRGTIEQQILAMHEEKRELAEALLSGADAGARVTSAELMALLTEAHEPAELPSDAARFTTTAEERERHRGAHLRVIEGGAASEPGRPTSSS